MKIKMLETRQGSPNGYEVRTYVKDASYEVPADLGNDLIAGKYAEAIVDTKAAASSSESGNGDTVTWPPADAAIDGLSFAALGELLASQGVEVGSLKSNEARRAAIRDLIAKQTAEAEAAAAAAQGDETGK